MPSRDLLDPTAYHPTPALERDGVLEVLPDDLPVAYAVTVFNLASEAPRTVAGRRTVGLWQAIEWAHRALQDNEDDIAAGGAYPYAIIELVGLNGVGQVAESRAWYQFDAAAGGYVPIPTPDGLDAGSPVGAIG